MTQPWELTPAQEAWEDRRYWDDRYAEPEPDDSDDEADA